MRLSKAEHFIRSVDDWFRYAPPRGGQYHWRDGYSAKELAKAWCGTGEPQVPADFANLLLNIPEFPLIRPGSGHPEHRIRFDGLPGEPRNADLVLHCESLGGIVGVSVEAKSRETFGEYVNDVILSAAKKFADEVPSGHLARLEALHRGLLRHRAPGSPPFGSLRYQLLTAAAGALVYAGSIHASAAVLVIHEFRPPNVPERRFADNARDLREFLHRITGAEPSPNQSIFGPIEIPGNDMIPGGMPFYICKLSTPCDPVVYPPRPIRAEA